MSPPLVELTNADVSFLGQRALSGLCWQIWPGERWAVLGANGSGKTTFLKLIRGDVWPDEPCSRRYAFDGVPHPSPIGAREWMGWVSNEQQTRYLHREWAMTCEDVVATGHFDSELLHQAPDERQRQRAHEVMEHLGISSLARRSIQLVSQGELRKILIARALVFRPRVLLLDEVAAGLDQPSRDALLDWLESSVPLETALVMSTHREEELIPSLSQVVVLSQGKIVQQGPRADLPPVSVQVKQAPSSCPRSQSAPSERRLLRICHADVFVGSTQALVDINWEVREGEHWHIVGDNGAGKSTLLKLVVGDFYPVVGAEVERFGSEGQTAWEIKRRIGYVSSELQNRFQAEEVNAFSAVASGFFSTLGLMDDLSNAQRARVDELMARFELRALSGKSLHRMSYGQARKVLLARALVTEPAALALDEPFDGLDARSREQLFLAVEQLAAGGTQLLLASHHSSDVLPFMTHRLVMKNGKVVSGNRLTGQVPW